MSIRHKIKFNKLLSGAVWLVAGFLTPLNAQVSNIVNNSVWYDTSSNEIEAQGGTIVQWGSTFYWYGMDLSLVGSNHVNLYTSTDLKTWTYQGNVADLTGIPGYVGTDWIGRPKVTYNSSTGNYVLFTEYANGDGNGRNKLTFYTSSSPYGPFEYQDFIPYPCGYPMGDLGSVLTDDTGTYLSFTIDNPEVDGSICIAKLTSTFLGIDSVVFNLFPSDYPYSSGNKEASDLISIGSQYYLFASDTNGWGSSGTTVWTASSLAGPWNWGYYVSTDPSSSNTFDTQNDQILPITGSAWTSYVYIGDRWTDEGGSSGVGQNQFYPVVFDIGNSNWPTIYGETNWYLNVATGAWSPASGSVYNPNFALSSGPSPDGWIVNSAQQEAVNVNTDGGYSGSNRLTFWSDSAYDAWVYQFVVGIPNGTYTATAWVESGGGQAYNQFMAFGYGGSQITSNIPTSSSWTPVTITNITVTNGQCALGFYQGASAEQWTNVGLVTLTED